MTGERDGEDRCKMTGAGLSDVPPPSPARLGGDDSQPPRLQRIRRARKVIRPLQRQTQGLCFLFSGRATYLLIDVLVEGQPTRCVQDNIQVTGV